MSMTPSYDRTINTITSEIEALESQLKPLEQQKQKLLQFRRELVKEREEVQKQEFIEKNGVTQCPSTGKSGKPKKKNNESKKTQFDALKELLAGMSDEEKRQLLDQYSDSGSDNPKENGDDDEDQGINIE